jgi:hypothetical protein
MSPRATPSGLIITYVRSSKMRSFTVGESF